MPCAEKIREGKRVTQDPDARKVSYKFESARILIFISIGAKCSNAPVWIQVAFHHVLFFVRIGLSMLITCSFLKQHNHVVAVCEGLRRRDPLTWKQCEARLFVKAKNMRSTPPVHFWTLWRESLTCRNVCNEALSGAPCDGAEGTGRQKTCSGGNHSERRQSEWQYQTVLRAQTGEELGRKELLHKLQVAANAKAAVPTTTLHLPFLLPILHFV